MKIGNNNPRPVGSNAAVGGDSKAAATPSKAKAKGAHEAGASAKVELSATASALSAAADDPSFDAAKVDRIAGAIKAGKFTVNHEAIADKLIANAQEVLGRVNGGH